VSETLDIELLGKTYRVACEPGERDSLGNAVSLLDQRLNEMRGKTRTPAERLAVMVALQLAHELVQRQNGAIDPAAPLPGLDTPLAPDELKRRIKTIETRIQAALDQNETLF
jgi:cell division protein ZapA